MGKAPGISLTMWRSILKTGWRLVVPWRRNMTRTLLCLTLHHWLSSTRI